jgi:branched-chain amino acid transport system permease protein
MPDLLPKIVLNEHEVAAGKLAAGGSPVEVRLDRDVTLLGQRRYRLEIVPADGAKTQNAGVAARAGAYAAGADLRVSPPPDPRKLKDASYRLILTPTVPIRLVDVTVVGTALLLMLALEWLIFRTKLGRGMRAVSFSPTTAALMGVPVDRVISFTFVLGSALAAAAGFLHIMRFPAGLTQPADASWVMLGLKAFVAAVIGGIGNVRGAMLGGLFIGLIEFFGAAYISTQYRDVYVFSLLIIVLLLRPTGILGKATVEKV